MPATAPTCMPTPPARSARRWRRAAARPRSTWPRDGTAPTGCSAHWMPVGCRDEPFSRAFAPPAPNVGPRMRILMVSWEYPPVVIGGLGRHVHHLSTALVEAGHDVVVLSRRPTGTDPSRSE